MALLAPGHDRCGLVARSDAVSPFGEPMAEPAAVPYQWIGPTFEPKISVDTGVCPDDPGM